MYAVLSYVDTMWEQPLTAPGSHPLTSSQHLRHPISHVAAHLCTCGFLSGIIFACRIYFPSSYASFKIQFMCHLLWKAFLTILSKIEPLPSFPVHFPCFIYLFNFLTALGLCWGFPGGSDGKESAFNAEDSGSIPGSEISPGEGNGSLSLRVGFPYLW